MTPLPGAALRVAIRSELDQDGLMREHVTAQEGGAARSRLSEFLRETQERIVAEWMREIRQLSPAQGLSTPALVDHLPAILVRISEMVESVDTGKRARLAELPKIHAVDRLARGFDLEAVVKEYAVLRRTILDLWERERGGTIRLAELRALDDAIDQAIAESAARYAGARERMLTALDRVSQAALGVTRLEEFLMQLLRASLEAMEAVDTVVIFLREGDRLRLRAAVGLEEEQAPEFSLRIGEGFAGAVAEEAHPRFVRDASTSPLVKSDVLRNEGVRALYGVPLTYAGEVIGVAKMGSRSAFEFSEEDRLLFQTMCSRATLVIHDAILMLREQASSAAARAFARASTFDEAFAALLPELGKALRWDVGCFWRVDGANEALRFHGIWTALPAVAPELEAESQGLTFRRGEGLPGLAWERGTTLYVLETSKAPDFPRRAVVAKAGLRTGIGFPLTIRGEVIGVMELFSKSLRWSSVESMSVTGLIVEQLGQFASRIAAQEAVRRKSAQTTAILEASLDCVVSMDARGGIVGWNRAAERTFGYSRAEVLGRDMADVIIPPRLRAAHRAGLSRYLRTGEQQYLNRRIEVAAIRRDGSELPVELTITQVPGEDPPRFTGFVRDIAEAKRMEEDLREREFRFRTLADNIPQLAWIADADGSIFWYNERWFDFTGTSLEEMRGWGWQRVHHPDHVERVVEKIRRSFETGTVWEDTFPLRSKDGHYRWFLSRAIPILDERGRVVRWFGTNTDVTEERFLRDVMATVTSSLDVREVASAIAKLAVPTLADWCAVDVVMSGGRSEQLAFEHVDPSRVALGPELRADASDGLRSTMIVPMIANGKTIGAISFGSAESGRRYASRDVEVAQELAARAGLALDNARLFRDAQQAARAREEILAVVSHDLKNPLNAIQMAAALLVGKSSSEDPRSRQQLETILRSTSRMNHLIGDLLDMASVQAGRLAVEQRPEDAASIIVEAVQMHEPAAREKGVAIVSACELHGRRLSCDRDRVLQVFDNLLGNAIKFCRAGDTITVRGEIASAEARFAVSDTGPGIPAGELPHVFEPYWSAKRHAKKGTGLGLYISKGIIDAHGGRLSVDSKHGDGATFSLTLPLAPASE